MKNTPCLSCIHLRGDEQAGFRCGASNNAKLEIDIVLRGAELNLPDCPFFILRKTERQGKNLKFDAEKKKLVVVVPSRRNRKYEYVQKVIIAKIPQLEKKLCRLPSGRELHSSLKIYSEPKSTYRILDAMVKDNILKKKRIGTGNKWGYEIA